MIPTAAETDATIASGMVDPVHRMARPSGCVNMKGTRKQGSAYFQVSIIVLYGFPPVIAFTSLFRLSEVSRRMYETRIATTIDQNTAVIVEKPATRKTMIAKSDAYWYQ